MSSIAPSARRAKPQRDTRMISDHPGATECRVGVGRGDSPKVNCATCHNGVYNSSFGAIMTKDFPAMTPVQQINQLPRRSARNVIYWGLGS